MKDYEYRCLSEFLKNNGVECHHYGDTSKVRALKKTGVEILFYSLYGENLFTGDCETLVLYRKPSDTPPSLTLLYAIRKYGQELICRQQSEP